MKHKTLPTINSEGLSDRASVVLLFGLALFMALYSIGRYQGLWGEIDTRSATVYIRKMFETATLFPRASAYPNGYAYQALAVFLMNASGISLPRLQIFGAPLLAVWLVIPVWLAYRELSGTARAASLSTVILFVQPEFLFVITRGTHEKFTRGLMLLCLYLLLRSLRSRSHLGHFAALVIAFYLSIYGVITYNNLIAFSFLVAVALALLLIGSIWFVRRFGKELVLPAIQRLAIVLAASIVLAFLFTFYLYPPAQHDIAVLGTIADRVAALFLDVEAESTNPYSKWVVGAWISLPVYFVMTLANWILLLLSVAIWLRQTVIWFIRRRWPAEARSLYLWAFFGAFALQGAASILIDYSGVLSANMQHRTFPAFAMLAAPVVAEWLAERTSPEAKAMHISYATTGVLIGLLAALSILKATNEPLVSNKWLFYSPGEMVAVEWSTTKLAGRTLWSAIDERVESSMYILHDRSPLGISFDGFLAQPGTRDFLISEITRAQQIRLHFPSPVAGDDLITYDNGQAQIYHKRPVTPYQR